MKLRFSDPDEFVNELRQAPPDAEPILRLTVRHELDRQTGVFRHLTVVASYLRQFKSTPEPTLLPVVLEAYQGQDWGGGFETSNATRARMEALLNRLRAVAEELGLDCRPGVYEPWHE